MNVEPGLMMAGMGIYWPELALVVGLVAQLVLLCVPSRWAGHTGPWLGVGTAGAVLVGAFWRYGMGDASVGPLAGLAAMLQLRWVAGQSAFMLSADVAAVASLAWLVLGGPGPVAGRAFHSRAMQAFFLTGALLGAHGLMLATQPVLSFVFLETLTLSGYAALAWPTDGRSYAKPALEALLRYILMGMFASACLVYGLSWAYGFSLLPPGQGVVVGGATESRHLVVWGLLAVALLFKLGAFPVHSWVAGVYQAGSLPVVAFISVVPKVAAAYWAFWLAEAAGIPLVELQTVLLILGCAGVLAGNVGAFFQTEFMRLMGFSSIAHSGFLLLCLASPQPVEVAGLYGLALLGINYLSFGLWGWLRGAGAEDQIASVAGWGRGAAGLALLAVVSALALAGLPPTFGFTAKFKLVLGLAGLAGELGPAVAYGAAAFAALNTAASLYYYLKLPFALIFRLPAAGAARPRLLVRSALPLVLLAAVLLGLFLLGDVVQIPVGAGR